MSDYTELIKALDCCGGYEYRCTECPYYDEQDRDSCGDILMCDAANAIEELQKQIGKKPSADVEERKTGKWIPVTCDDGHGEYKLYKCNKCGALSARSRNYCYDCGARMEDK